MSDYNPFSEVHPGGDSPAIEDPIGAPGDGGQPTEPEITAEPPRSYLDIDDDVAQRYVRVKVDGQDVEVPLQEALRGYSRQEDYTRKTQQLAAERQQAEYALAVQRALQASPAEALELLARQHGVQLGQSPPPSRERPSILDDDDDEYESPYATPMEKRLAQIERQNQAITSQWEERQANERLRMAVGGLQQRYGADEATVREVVGRALQLRMGPESFDMIYKNLAFDRAHQARQQAEAQRAQARQGARDNAQQLIGNGVSANHTAGVPPPDTSDRRMSISEAFDAALRESGASI